MFYYIVDDDEVFRSMLSQIIEDGDLGEVIGEADDGAFIEADQLNFKKIDILFIDLLMPMRDGIETVRHIASTFTGKIIMISQVESKQLIGEAYTFGVEYYITKPLNKIEVVSVVRKVIERIRLERSIHDIQKSLNNVFQWEKPQLRTEPVQEGKKIGDLGRFLLSELGIAGENGSKDLLSMLEYLYGQEKAQTFDFGFPALKEIFHHITIRKLGDIALEADIDKEKKASEQRVRRAIYQSLNHLASLGLTDFSNPKFESYAPKFFDFTVVRKRMTEMTKDELASSGHTRINTKKFIQVLYFEAKRLMERE
ncbi:transcriptional regulatory protein GlnL [Bacillus thuringiensis serovar morrisoni str. 4AA1]|uniref:response regulator n=1 Tax=Bacillus TaxID=1386 RepID=UPI0005CEBFEC|nr:MULTISPECIES: response regulator [Bacillus]AJQ58503.1 transcriptional regulator [Bacillus thuringiensis serovar morrisoni]MED3099651.1 response regulator [Bacillus thuringiensis]MRA97519.1 response regulator [Bacillus thuringiensis]OTY31993.1 transcriptional regulator [Bacillus thuringiensis serovar poloniensis]RNG58872.1 response regulator [Bacillus thuringiensis]